MRDAELIDQFASLVLGADDPRRLGRQTLDVVMAMTRARSAAILRPERDRLSLFASVGIDQIALDVADAVWAACRSELEKGQPFYVPDRGSDKRFKKLLEKADVRSVAVVPVVENASVAALLYVDSTAQRFCDDGGVERLGKFGRIVAKAIGSNVTGGLLSWPVDGAAASFAAPQRGSREELLLALRNHEWNIARASRELGVTRRTIYLRLARFGVAREKIRRSEVRLRTKPAVARA